MGVRLQLKEHSDNHNQSRLPLIHQEVTRAIQASGCSVASTPVQKRTLSVVVMIFEEGYGIRESPIDIFRVRFNL